MNNKNKEIVGDCFKVEIIRERGVRDSIVYHVEKDNGDIAFVDGDTFKEI
jgi:hypothetical protein